MQQLIDRIIQGDSSMENESHSVTDSSSDESSADSQQPNEHT